MDRDSIDPRGEGTVAFSPQGIALICMLSQLMLPPALKTQGHGQPENQPRIVEQFPIYNDGDLVLLPVKLGDKNYQFVLDTGTSLNLYDSALRPLLGPSLYANTVNTACGKMQAEFFNPPKATLGMMSLRTFETVICSDLVELREASGHEIYGIIGMEFLKDHVVSIDFDEGRLAFLESAESCIGTAVPLYKESVNRYLVNIKVSGIGLRKFQIDTGSRHSGTIGASDFDLLRKRERIGLLQSTETTGLSGFCRKRSGVVEELALGHFRHSNVELDSNENDDPSNTIGIPLLSQYNIVFDFPHEVAYFRKSRHFGQADNPDLSGLTLHRKEGHVVVDSVEENSVAARGGVRPGDVLLKIDGADAYRIRKHLLDLRLSLIGRKVQLTFQRDRRSFEVFLVLPSQHIAQKSDTAPSTVGTSHPPRGTAPSPRVGTRPARLRSDLDSVSGR